MVVGYLSKNVIKVPKNVTCYFCEESSFLYITGKIGSKLLKLEVKIYLLAVESIIVLTNESFQDVKVSIQKGSLVKTKMLIKKAFLEVTRKSYKKLKLVGVGFRVNLLDFEQSKLLKFDLGYSHSVYYKIPKDIEVILNSTTKFIVSGVSSDRVGEVSSTLRKFKLPDSYKGKGILYENEEVKLKNIRKS